MALDFSKYGTPVDGDETKLDFSALGTPIDEEKSPSKEPSRSEGSSFLSLDRAKQVVQDMVSLVPGMGRDEPSKPAAPGLTTQQMERLAERDAADREKLRAINPKAEEFQINALLKQKRDSEAMPPKASSVEARAAGYTKASPGMSSYDAQRNAEFDKSLENRWNAEFQKREADPVSGDRIQRSYRPEEEAARVQAEAQERLDAELTSNARRLAQTDPLLSGALSSLLSGSIGIANAPQTLVNAVIEAGDKLQGFATGADGNAPKLPKWGFTDEGMKLVDAAIPVAARKDLTDAWKEGDFGSTLLAKMSSNSVSSMMSLAAMFAPPLRAALLPTMGAMAAGQAYSQGDSAIGSTLKGGAEIVTEKLPLGVLDSVMKVPLPLRDTVLRSAADKLIKAGAVVTSQGLVNAIEESAAQVAGNAVDRYVEGKSVSSLGAGVADAAILGAATGGAMSMPAVGLIASEAGTKQGAAAQALAGALNQDLVPDAQNVVEFANRNYTTDGNIRPEATVVQTPESKLAALQAERDKLMAMRAAATPTPEAVGSAITSPEVSSVDQAIAVAQAATNSPVVNGLDSEIQSVTAGIAAMESQLESGAKAAAQVESAIKSAIPGVDQNALLAGVQQQLGGAAPDATLINEGTITEQKDITGKPAASWVIRDKATGAVQFETYNPDLVSKINTVKYEAVPIGKYLAGINAETRKTKISEWSDRESAPVGSWVKADFKLENSQPVYQVREIPISDLYLPELTRDGKLQPEKRKYLDSYTERYKAGEVAPSINVIEMEDGRLRVVDGHRRALAAQAAGQKTIRALVSPLIDTPSGKAEATLELVQNSPATDRIGGQTPQSQVAGVSSSETTGPRFYGVDSQPMDEGGKPFKSQAEAKKAQKLQPHLRVKKVGGGFALTEKTAKQLAAEAQAAKRLGAIGTGGKPLAVHEFLAAMGGLSKSTQSDLNFDKNLKLGGKYLFTNAGMSLERAVEMLGQYGYMQGTNQNDAITLIQKSAKGQPQYTPEGWDAIAQAEAEARFEDHLRAQQDAMQDDDFDPFASTGEPFLMDDDMGESGYDQASSDIQAEVAALTEQAESLGIDTEAIVERAAQDTENQPDQAYYERTKQLIQDAIQASTGSRSNATDAGENSVQGRQDAEPAGRGNRGEADGSEGTSGTESEDLDASFRPRPTVDSVLTAPTEDDVLANQDREENADALDEREQIRRESEAGAGSFQLQAQDGRVDDTGFLFSRTGKQDVKVDFKPGTQFLQATSDAGMVGGTVKDGVLRITHAEVAEEQRGKGEGIKLYSALIDKALADGLKVTSDSTVEADAVRVYEALGRRGYDVNRLEGGTTEDGAAYGKGATEPAFAVNGGPKIGAFGPILTQYRHDPTGAIKALTAMQDGEAVAALYHPEVGDIDLVWGVAPSGKNQGHGLAKLIDKHPEVMGDLQGFLLSLKRDDKASGKNRIRLVDGRKHAVVSLDWFGEGKTWLLTAYENGAEAGTRMDTASNGLGGDTARSKPGAVSSLPNEDAESQPKRSFAGAKAQTADQFQLSKAQEMLERKVDPEVVRRETGWSKGVDGKWRFEISDDEAKLNIGYKGYSIDAAMNGVPVGAGGWMKLGDVLDHPKLYAAYPQMRDLELKLVHYTQMDGAKGSYSPNTNTIRLNGALTKTEALSTLMHEVQHAIQEYEGFAVGGSSDSEFGSAVKDALATLEKQAKQKIEVWRARNQDKLDAEAKTSRMARQALMWESSQRLMEYANRDKPSGVFRLIKNEIQWIYDADFRGVQEAMELQRMFYSVPPSHKMKERNAYISDMAYRASQLFQGTIDRANLVNFRDDDRTTKAIVAAMRRQAAKARKELQPLYELERDARNAQAVKKAHEFSTPYEVYRALAGEVEARNTQARLKMTDEERRNKSPLMTADVKPEQVVVMFGGLEIEAPMLSLGDQPAFTPDQLRAAAKKTHGNLLEQGEKKGIVKLAGMDELIDQAAKDRAEVTGGDWQEIKKSILKSVQNSIRVWHGSPHRFTKFSLSAIGSGEGAQAYGWGLYFASAQGVADYYRRALSAGEVVIDGTPVQSGMVYRTAMHANKDGIPVSKETLLDYIAEQIAETESKGEKFRSVADMFRRTAEQIRSTKSVEMGGSNGRLYEANIIPDEDSFLLWDKPLGEQPEAVQDAVDDAIRTAPGADEMIITRYESQAAWMTGEEIYKLLSGRQLELYGQRGASEHLLEHGIKGIKYLDGTSRGAGEGSFNYVVFDDADVEIIDVKFSANGDINGFHDPKTGKSYLNADTLTPDTVGPVMIHELWHAANVDGAMDAVNNRALSMIKAGKGNPFFDDVAKMMADAGETSAEEASAYLVQKWEQDTINSPEPVKRWVKNLVAAVRAWLFNKGILLRADQLTEADIAAVARMLAKQQVTGQNESGAVQFSKSIGEKVGNFYQGLRSRLALGRGYSEDDLLAALGGRPDRRGYIHHRRGAAAFQGGLATAYWEGSLAGQDGYYTAATTLRQNGQPTLLMAVFPSDALLDGSPADVERALRERKEAWYLYASQTPSGVWEVGTDGASPGHVYFDKLVELGELKPVQGGYHRLTLPDGTTEWDLLREGTRRLSMFLDGNTPAVQFVRATGAKPGKSAVWEPARLEAKFSQAKFENSAAFRRWFGDSKVVDADGNPLVVYHGTGADFTVFDASKTFDGGFYFTPNEEYADEFGAMKTQGDVKKIAAYITIKDPLEIDAEGVSFDEDMQNRLMDEIQRGKMTGQFDGIVVRNLDALGYGDQSDMWIAFRPEQIKSATGNNGNYDPTNPDIRYSRGRRQGNLFASRFNIEDETKLQQFQRKVQDHFNRVKVVQYLLREQGGNIDEASDVYRAEERMHGIVQEKMVDLRDQVLEPLVKLTAASGIELDELALYAYAKHAQERNAHIQGLRSDMPDNGSGMTDTEAQDILDAVAQSGKQAEYDELHRKLMEVNRMRQDVQLQAGLITQEEYDAWRNQYQNYVPLRGFEAVNDEGKISEKGKGTGRKFNIRGKETMRALGRQTRAADIIENIISDYQTAVVRAEKNSVLQRFLKLVMDNPDPDLWEIDAVKTRASMDRATGKVSSDFVIDKGPNTIGLKVNGREVYLKIHDDLLARALRGPEDNGAAQTARMITNITGHYLNLLRNTITRFNPEFALTNMERDLGMALPAVIDDLGEKGGALFAKYYPGATAASAAALMGKLNKMSPEWQQYFTEYRESGGTTGGFYVMDADELRTDLRMMMVAAGAEPRTAYERVVKATQKVGLRHAGKALEFLGATSEHAARVAAFRAAREMGKSAAEAAAIAKNLTTNFNRKGEWGGLVNSLYLFANANIQGNARLFKMLKNRKMIKYFAGMTGAMAALAMWNAGTGGDDDDDEPYWDKIPQYIKERNIIIMLPPGFEMDGAEKVGKKGRYITIAAPFGLNTFSNLGYELYDVYRHAQNPMHGHSAGRAAWNMASGVVASLNPFGGSLQSQEAALLAVLPTIFDLPAQFIMGVDAFGKPVAPRVYDEDSIVKSENVNMRQSGGPAHMLARWINKITGGDEETKGVVDLSPGALENVARNVTGGAGKFIYDSIALAGKAFDEDPDIFVRDVPFVRRAYGEVDGDVDQGLFYERRADINEAKAEAKRKEQAGKELTNAEVIAKASMSKDAGKITKRLSKIRQEIIELKKDDSLSDTYKRARERELKRERDELVTSFNQMWREVMEAYEKGEFDQ